MTANFATVKMGPVGINGRMCSFVAHVESRRHHQYGAAGCMTARVEQLVCSRSVCDRAVQARRRGGRVSADFESLIGCAFGAYWSPMCWAWAAIP